MALVVGLAGGIGCGKSAVADLLVARGAELIDADVVAREVVAPGGPAYGPLVDRFGRGILAADGTVDRPALAAVAFADDRALADLNGITHPAIGAAMLARREALAATDKVVVVAIPLLRAEHRESMGLDVVVVVDCPVDVALQRLVEQRGMPREDAQARIAAQMARDDRRTLADYVLDNGGSLDQLPGEVDRLWAWLQDKRAARTDRGSPA
ncbi:MAG TPA: dephospho-CoA kinase [Acidimicrobiales bacterium]|nr:dephospho-CoA kinase [Acidimicrobiales bacterium]